MIRRNQISKSATVRSPIGGLNAKDSIASMPSGDAVLLQNFVSQPDGVTLRKGSVDWVTGFADAVESLMSYRSATVNKLFAAAGSGIFGATTEGAVGSEEVSGLSNARWQHVNFGTAAGQFLVAVNGSDSPILFNGSNWQRIDAGTMTVSSITRVGTLCTVTTSAAHNLTTGQNVIVSGCTETDYNGTFQATVTDSTHFTYTALSTPSASPATGSPACVAQIKITGVTASLFISVNSFGQRLWFTEKDSSRIWYLPVASVGGAATSIDFSSLFKLGGYLQGMMTWSLDSGTGMQEYAVFVSSVGEVLVYGGQDPTTTADWGLVAHVRMGRPIGRRFWVKVGSDAIILTADGFYPLQQSILTDRSQQKIAISDKIQNLVNADVQTYNANFGWQAILHPIGNKLIVNVPVIEGVSQYQYVLNTITNAWCKFTGWNANCFETFDDGLYYGGASAVVKADHDYDDNGNDIVGEVIQAFSYFGDIAQKQFTFVRPTFRTSGAVRLTLQLNTDFFLNSLAQTPTMGASSSSMWDVAEWDDALWASEETIVHKWISVGALGYNAAIHMKIAGNGIPVKWLSTDYQYLRGGPI